MTSVPSVSLQPAASGMTKFCKDCKHNTKGYYGSTLCKLLWDDDVVTGHRSYAYASAMRDEEKGICRKDAVLFEPKLSLWQRIKLHAMSPAISHGPL